MEKEGIAAFVDRDGVITALSSYESGEKSKYLTKKVRNFTGKLVKRTFVSIETAIAKK